MEKKFEITFSYWKQKEFGYFDAFQDLDKCVSHVLQSRIVRANNSNEAKERLQSVYPEQLNIIKIKEIQQQREMIINGR